MSQGTPEPECMNQVRVGILTPIHYMTDNSWFFLFIK